MKLVHNGSLTTSADSRRRQSPTAETVQGYQSRTEVRHYTVQVHDKAQRAPA